MYRTGNTDSVLKEKKDDSQQFKQPSDANGHIKFECVPLGTYYLKETVAPNGYLLDENPKVAKVVADKNKVTYTINGQQVVSLSDLYGITNTEKTNVRVKKIWEHGTNTNLPTSLTVTLSNGTKVKLNADNQWEATVEKLPKYDSEGNSIEYTWTEEGLPAGYYMSGYTQSTEAGVVSTTITNTFSDSYNPMTNISGKKIWVDDGKDRPAAITVNLYQGGNTTPYRTITVNAPTGEGANQNEWPFEFTNLPIFDDDGSIIQYRVEEVLPTGYTEDYAIKVEFKKATYVAGEAEGQIVNSGQGSQVFELCDGTDLGWIVIRHGNDFIVWTPRPATDVEKKMIKDNVVKLSYQFNGINSATVNSMKYQSGVPMTVDVGNKHAVSVYMNGTKVMMKFLNPNAWSDFAYGTIPYTYTAAEGTITNVKKVIDISGIELLKRRQQLVRLV